MAAYSDVVMLVERVAALERLVMKLTELVAQPPSQRECVQGPQAGAAPYSKLAKDKNTQKREEEAEPVWKTVKGKSRKHKILIPSLQIQHVITMRNATSETALKTSSECCKRESMIAEPSYILFKANAKCTHG